MLPILIAKVDALVPVLGASIVAEFVEKPLHMVIGSEPPSNVVQIHALARRKCAMDILSSTLDDEYTSLLHSSTKYLRLTPVFYPVVPRRRTTLGRS